MKQLIERNGKTFLADRRGGVCYLWYEGHRIATIIHRGPKYATVQGDAYHYTDYHWYDTFEEALEASIDGHSLV